MTTFKENWQAWESGHPTAHNQIAARLNRVIYATDYNNLQSAVDAAKNQHDGYGGVVYLSPGHYVIDEPLVLPRTGATPDNVVHLIGAGHYMTRIVGSASFPENRALIEWEDTAARAWEQRICNLTLALPDVAGVKAIHYALSGGTISYAVMDAQRLEVQLENLYITANNDYHETMIDLEGYISTPVIRNICGDPSQGSSATYNTLLLRTDSDIDGADPGGADAPGFFSGIVQGLRAGKRRGGYVRAFSGRLLGTIFEDSFCNGGLEEPAFEFINCLSGNLRTLLTEGQGEKPQYKFTNCAYMSVQNIHIGTPDAVGESGVGNGMELVNTHDCTFDGRWNDATKPAFSGKGVKVLTVDANSARNTFTRWGIRSGGTPADEFTIAGTDNSVSYHDYQTGSSGTITSD